MTSGGALRFVAGNLDHPDVVALLQLHLDSAHANSPAEMVHALDLSALRDRHVTFWSVWDGEGLAGMGALKRIDDARAEIKSMRVVPDRLRRGIGAAMLDHLLREARARGFAWVGLETGGNDAFAPARAMYERAGFAPCEGFGDYQVGEFTRCYGLQLR